MSKLFSFLPILIFMISCNAQKTNEQSVATKTQNADVIVNKVNSEKWPGVYYGKLPCAETDSPEIDDCIEMTIQLNDDQTYKMALVYPGGNAKPLISEGSFEWSPDGSKLSVENDHTYQFLFEKDQLILLDENGDRITGRLQNRYMLKRSDNTFESSLGNFEFDESVLNKYWKLIELNGQPVEVLESMRKEPYFKLNLNDNSMIGHGGCNAFFGTYELLGGNRISIHDMGATEMFCMDNKVEGPFMKVLMKVDTYSIKNDTLQLSKSKTSPLAVFKAIYF